MFRLTLGKRLFVALALLLSFSLVLFVGLSRLALHQGIGQYVAEIELSRLDWVVANLQEAYARDKGWQSFTNNDSWRAALTPSREFFREQMRRGRPPPFMSGPRAMSSSGTAESRIDESQNDFPLLPFKDFPPPPERDGFRGGPRDMIYDRLALIDAADGRLVAGSIRAMESSARMKLTSGGKTVGFLALAPLDGIRTDADRTFAAKQLSFILVTGVLGLLIALFLSGWLARRWLAPIERLVKGAQALAQGDLGHVVDNSGSDEFATLTTTFNHMSQKLASIEESRQRWLSDAAHELRTPVAAMRGEIEAIQDGIRTFDSNAAQRLHGQVMRLGKLIDDLRLVSEDTYAMSADTGDVLPLKVLCDCIASMGARFEQADIRVLGVHQIEMLDHDVDCRIQGDDGRLSQVFSNLLDNSLKYTEPGGVLQVSATIAKDESTKAWVLSIFLDDSPPQPLPADLDRLFDRFYRAESSRARATGGSGLGLSICRAIVSAHGGTIHASASPLGGLRVTVAFTLKNQS